MKQPQWTDWADGNATFMEYAYPYTLEEFERQANSYARSKFGVAGALPPKMVEVGNWLFLTKVFQRCPLLQQS